MSSKEEDIERKRKQSSMVDSCGTSTHSHREKRSKLEISDLNKGFDDIKGKILGKNEALAQTKSKTEKMKLLKERLKKKKESKMSKLQSLKEKLRKKKEKHHQTTSLAQKPVSSSRKKTVVQNNLFDSSNQQEKKTHLSKLALIRKKLESSSKASIHQPLTIKPTSDEDPFDVYMQNLKPEHSKKKIIGEFIDIESPEESIFSNWKKNQQLKFAKLSKNQKKRNEGILTYKKNHAFFPYRQVVKNIYIPGSSILNATKDSIKYLRGLEDIEVSGKGRFDPYLCPIDSWAHCGLSDSIMRALNKNGWTTPLSVQKQAIPILMSGRDAIVIAKTGSGKTLGFVLSLIRHVLKDLEDETEINPEKFYNKFFSGSNESELTRMRQADLHSANDPEFQLEISKYRGDNPGVRGLILVPSRELSAQICSVLDQFTAFEEKISFLECCGGTDISAQISALRSSQNITVIVGTPGRVIELLQRNSGKLLSLRNVSFVVLDEADRVFDKGIFRICRLYLGFLPQIEEIMKCVRPDKQMSMFSATFPPQVEALAKELLRFRFCEVTVGGRTKASNLIQQRVELVSIREKTQVLLRYLGLFFQNKLEVHTGDHKQTSLEYNLSTSKVLVFVNEQDEADRLFKRLKKFGYDCLSLHGASDQEDRTNALSQFKARSDSENAINILVATGVAGRGIDVPNLDMVVNYDVPNHIEEYIHRIGRTGRARRQGLSITLLTPEDEAFAPDLVKAFTQSKNPMTRTQGEQWEFLKQLSDTFREKIKNGEAMFRSSGYRGSGLLSKGEKGKSVQSKMKKTVENDKREQLGFIKPGVKDKGASDSEKSDDSDEELKTKKRKKRRKVNPFQIARETAARITNSESQGVADIFTSKKEAIVEGVVREVEWFSKIIDINDYPQNVRVQVTNKVWLNQVANRTGTEIMVRGEFRTKGRKTAGSQRLHLLIEGPKVNSIHAAESEISEMIEDEGAISQFRENGGAVALGNYSVL
eukprot:maker-scaffold_42-snap-gene-0.54-mRNA-1 protein AED:0.24 eAED:0.25 QI:0/0/0/1/1/1/2/0/987